MRRPAGLVAASMCATLFAAWMARFLFLLDDPVFGTWNPAVFRAAAALLAAVGAVAAEALWNRRPWAWRASLALAAGYAALMILLGVWGGGARGVIGSAVALCVSAVVIVPMLACIRRHAAVPGGAVPRPRPRP